MCVHSALPSAARVRYVLEAVKTGQLVSYTYLRTKDNVSYLHSLLGQFWGFSFHSAVSILHNYLFCRGGLFPVLIHISDVGVREIQRLALSR